VDPQRLATPRSALSEAGEAIERARLATAVAGAEAGSWAGDGGPFLPSVLDLLATLDGAGQRSRSDIVMMADRLRRAESSYLDVEDRARSVPHR
jgi:hypothetical protein